MTTAASASFSEASALHSATPRWVQAVVKFDITHAWDSAGSSSPFPRHPGRLGVISQLPVWLWQTCLWLPSHRYHPLHTHYSRWRSGCSPAGNHSARLLIWIRNRYPTHPRK
jgi:hypothetical protein